MYICTLTNIYTANIEVYILICIELYILIYITWTRLYVLYSWCVYVHWHIRHLVDESGKCISYTYMYTLLLGNLWTKTACTHTQVHVHSIYWYMHIDMYYIFTLHTWLLVDEAALPVHPNIYIANIEVYILICIT